MQRFLIVMAAMLIGAAAPARAWCEATCLAPVSHAGETAKPHCAAHEASSDTTTMSASDGADCPVIESARPVVAKVNLLPSPAPAASHPESWGAAAFGTPAPRHLGSRHFLVRSLPLRI